MVRTRLEKQPLNRLRPKKKIVFRGFLCMCLCATNNNFISRFNSDGIDHFQQVKQNRQNYNEILENFLMEQQNQQRKQFQAINADDEFSDEVNN